MIFKYFPNLNNSSETCIASSLVGQITRVSTVPSHFILFKTGNPNAAVFPVPVCACAMISLPSRIIGIASACTGLGSAKPALFIAWLSSSLRLKSSNFIFFPFYTELCNRKV